MRSAGLSLVNQGIDAPVFVATWAQAHLPYWIRELKMRSKGFFDQIQTVHENLSDGSNVLRTRKGKHDVIQPTNEMIQR